MADSEPIFDHTTTLPSTRLGEALCAPALNDISVSFEFFPPSTDKIAEQVWNAILRLAPLEPGCGSVTYGAGGTTRLTSPRSGPLDCMGGRGAFDTR